MYVYFSRQINNRSPKKRNYKDKMKVIIILTSFSIIINDCFVINFTLVKLIDYNEDNNRSLLHAVTKFIYPPKLTFSISPM